MIIKSLKFRVFFLFLFLILICISGMVHAQETEEKEVVFAMTAHAMAGDSVKGMIKGALEEIEALGWDSMVTSAEGSVERQIF